MMGAMTDTRITVQNVSAGPVDITAEGRQLAADAWASVVRDDTAVKRGLSRRVLAQYKDAGTPLPRGLRPDARKAIQETRDANAAPAAEADTAQAKAGTPAAKEQS